MKKVISRIRDYFGISHQEARGLFVLLLLTGSLLLLPLVYRLWMPNSVPDTSPTDKRHLDSLVALLEVDKVITNERYEKAPGRYEPAIESRKAERFAFNPNTIDVESWQRLGAPHWLAERIVRYRSKGGQFRKKEDLLKIYDFSPDLYSELEPYIQLSTEKSGRKPLDNQREQYALNGPNYDRALAARPPTYSAERYNKPALQPFDINTADTTELKKIHGIGSKLAGRIIKFREALGGFVSTDQYAEIFGLDSLAVGELTKYGRLQTPVKKIAVNTATAEELDRHTYISRRQAEVIVNYRTQHGPYTSSESLRNIRILDIKTIEKITPYLVF